MKRFGLVTTMIALAATCLIVSVRAQVSSQSWPFFVEVSTQSTSPGMHDLIVPFDVMDKAREDLADLRLFDVAGHEIPYAIRVRKEVGDRREIAAKIFNQSTTGSTIREVSVDLGENTADHNEIEIDTAGTNFRRRVELDGGDSGKEWRTLKTGDVIFRFESQNKSVESNRIIYPTSRYRYLRVRVFTDELTDKQPPVVSQVKVVMAIHEKGELTTWTVAAPPYQLLRNQGSPASAWIIDLGARVPCDRLALEIYDESFSRQFQLEAFDDPQNARLIASGELNRRAGEPHQPLLVKFDKEEHSRKLRLLITDYSNPMLTINSINASAPARQMIFELKEPVNGQLRLYFGNLKATSPHYDFEKNLSGRIVSDPMVSIVGGLTNNPDYRPEPKPLTERLPWLIYVVLSISSLALALILVNLARATRQSDPVAESPSAPAGNH